MSVNTSIGLIAVSKQDGKSNPASEPSFQHGLTGGQVFKLDRTVENANVSCGVRSGTDSYVDSIGTGVDFETYGYSDVVPLYYYGALGNIVSSEADGKPGLHRHVATMGDSLPYLTFWGRIGNEFTRTDSCKIDQLEMEFEGNKPLSFGVTAVGMGAALGLDSIPGASDPSCFDGYFVPTGGTFKIDTASSAPVEAPVLKGSLALANSCETSQLAGQITPGAVDEGKLKCSGSVTVKPDDLTPYKQMVTGSASGRTPTGTMVYGSFEWTFRHSRNPDHTLSISSGRVPFTCDFPEVNPDGGAAELEFSFDDIGVDTRDGSPVTVVVVNATESY